MEVAGGANKGRNIIKLLADAARGDDQAAFVWYSGVTEIINRKVTSLRWSRGLRDLLGVPSEKSDEDVAAEEVTETDRHLGQLNFHQWRVVVDHRAELALCIAANNGLQAVNSFLTGLGAGVLDTDTEEVETSMRRDHEILCDSLKEKAPHAVVIAEWQREIERPSLVLVNKLREQKRRNQKC